MSRALAGTGVAVIAAAVSGMACGPEMFHQGVEDAGSDDVPIVDPGTGGVGGNPGDGLGGTGDSDMGSAPRPAAASAAMGRCRLSRSPSPSTPRRD